MKNILVYIVDCMMSPRGGKLGYNYFLKKELDNLGVTNIHYIHRETSINQNVNSRIHSLKQDRIKKLSYYIEECLSEVSDTVWL